MKNLKKFIEENHQTTNRVLFWSDKASAHYASSVTTWLDSEGTVFVPKHDNPSDGPQVRPIEHFWANVYELGWTAKNETDLAKRIKTKTCSGTFPQKFESLAIMASKLSLRLSYRCWRLSTSSMFRFERSCFFKTWQISVEFLSLLLPLT